MNAMGRMSRIRHSIVVVSLVGMLAILTEAAAARSIVDGWERGYYSGPEQPISGQESWAGYYAKHAQVGNSPEKRLANGVRWRLATDRRTHIAMPRIVWMPNDRSLRVANRMLEMTHGGAMLFSEQQQEGYWEQLRRYEEEGPFWAGQSKEERKRLFQFVRKSTPKRIVKQTDVALTYASARFVSLIDLGYIYTYEGTYIPRIVRSLTFDLEQRRIFTMQACPEGSFKRPGAIFTSTFRFASLLEICDQENLERFEALVLAADDRAKSLTTNSKDPLVQRCRKAPLEYEQEYVVYLAETGLAVHLLYFWVIADIGTCTLTLTARNPVIVPYRELEPLMTPGPLREELLKSR